MQRAQKPIGKQQTIFLFKDKAIGAELRMMSNDQR